MKEKWKKYFPPSIVFILNFITVLESITQSGYLNLKFTFFFLVQEMYIIGFRFASVWGKKGMKYINGFRIERNVILFALKTQIKEINIQERKKTRFASRRSGVKIRKRVLS